MSVAARVLVRPDYTTVATVLIRYWAAARAAAGVESEVIDASNVAEALRAVGAGRGELAGVVERSSLLLDGVVVHDRAEPLLAGQTLEVLPPFAGGAS